MKVISIRIKWKNGSITEQNVNLETIFHFNAIPASLHDGDVIEELYIAVVDRNETK